MKTILVRIPGSPCPVYVGAGLDRLSGGAAVRRLGQRVMVVTDHTVAALHGERVVEALRASGREVVMHSVAPGEKSKTFGALSDIVRACARVPMDRSDSIVTVGGGVVSDLGGFAASVYLRGISFAAVPTTLLAQVDAAVGGKSGVDLPEGKNLAGTFHQPVFVLMDLKTLETLPARETAQGLAEIIKYGVIKSAAMFAFLEKAGQGGWKKRLAWLVEQSVRIKAAVVAKDEKERTGVREVLNFGHTIGHAVEAAYMPRFRHGEAVALGMVAESAVGMGLGITPRPVYDRVVELVRRLGLPWDVSIIDPGLILETMKRDKKARSGFARLVVPEAIGRAKCGVRVRPEDICRRWEEWCHG